MKGKINTIYQFRLLTILLVMTAVGALSACSTTEPTMALNAVKDVVVHNAYSKDVQVNTWTLAEGGNKNKGSTLVGLGFVRPEDRNTPPSQLTQNVELALNSGEPLKLDLIIESGQSTPFLVTVLVDYKQVAFSMDGQYGLLHEIYVESTGDPDAPAQVLYIPVEIDIFGPGAHDVVVLGFKNPYDRVWDPEARESGNLSCGLGGQRIVVIVDEVESPYQNISPDVFAAAPPPEIDFGLRVLFAELPTSSLDSSHPSKRQMKFTQNGRAGKDFRYQMWLSNYALPDDVVDIAYFRFLDYHQINFKGKDLFVVHFDGRQETIVDDFITLPSQKGVHELQIVYLFDPYKSLLREEVLAPFVMVSDCLGINVK